ncbi:hypothetical protein ON058_10495 [Demequina sp. B12]|uniref:hypothetical protein n=1 Tax=Demequina sp. B12 TaxID=2992757 RepID=UPI00237A39BE|nr:hypothetical protein [Demequina sp. B12]MDE0573839.1 hypothetical protein [Demequina sp. B12]
MLRVIARPLLATWFVYGGVQSVLEPEKRAERAAPVIEPALAEAGVEGVKTTDIVKAHGAATIVAASVLALSRTPRTAGLVLAGLTAATVAAGRPFWLETDEEKKEEQMEFFLRNVSLLGGTLLAATAGHNPKRKARAKVKKEKAQVKKDKAAAKSAKSSGKATVEAKKTRRGAVVSASKK